MADITTAKNAGLRAAGKAAGKGGLDTPLSGRQRILPKFSPNPDAFGHATEGFARFMGTPTFLVYMTIFCVFWLVWNTFAPKEWQFDSQALGYTLLTLMLSLQASYAAPLLLLAQNRQDDRDRVSLQQDRQQAARNLADTEYLTRELASLRIALREVATRDYVRAELRTLLEDMLEAQEEMRAHGTGDTKGGESPREKVKDKLKEKRDKQRGPRTQQIPKVRPQHTGPQHSTQEPAEPAQPAAPAPEAEPAPLAQQPEQPESRS